MVAHMNADHVDAMRRYCAVAGYTPAADCSPRFAGCDALGFHLQVGGRVLRIPFERAVETPQGVRQQLMTLARR
jgi:putative heme iron utilization protein